MALPKRYITSVLSWTVSKPQRRRTKTVRYIYEEQIIGDKSIWDPLTKRKFPTFASNIKSTTVKIKDQLVNIKDERKFMTRLVVASRTRPEIDLKYYLGKYEFSVVPRSLFSPNRKLLPTTDKSIIIREINVSTMQMNSSQRFCLKLLVLRRYVLYSIDI